MAGRSRWMASSARRALAGARGFNLLEVMIALAILAVVMAAVTSTQGSSLLHGARVYNLTVATQLLDGVVLDLEEEYRLEGFPTNDLEDRDCELEREFGDFDCEYDLVGLDVSADNISNMGADANAALDGSPLLQGLCSGGANGNQLAGATEMAHSMGAQYQQHAGTLAMLHNPDLQNMCNLNPQQICSQLPMIATAIPMIIEQAAKAVRKLRVRLSWDERGRSRKTIEIETYLTAVPEAEEENMGP